MRLHRFYITSGIDLKHDFWLHEPNLIRQLSKVLRYQAGQELILFDGQRQDRLYKIMQLTDKEAHLQLVTEMARQIPERTIYLFWSLLKKDKNDWVLQKCTELGVSHFVPILADRSEKTGFNEDRAQKIVIEASEQCGRSDIPTIREPIRLSTVFKEFEDKLPLYICEQNGESVVSGANDVGLLIGPEGGWSEAEKRLFESKKLNYINLHNFTLRAETACVTAVSKLIQ